MVKFLEDDFQNSEDIKKIFKSVDKNGDGVISKSEFVELLVQQKSEKLMRDI